MEISHMSQSLRRPYLSFLALLLTATGLIGCAVGPNYKRPTVNVPVTYRGATADSSASPERRPKHRSLE